MLMQKQVKTFFIDLIYFIGGSILYGLSLYTFALNANFAPGGISGLSIILHQFTNLPIGILSVLLNIPIVLVCMRVVGFKFLTKSIGVMVINTFFLDVIFPLLPVYEGSPLLASMFSGILLGAGLGLIYMRGASTGGADFIIMTVKKLHPHFTVGRISLAIDMAVILAGGFVFQNVDAVLYGLICSVGCTLMMDNVLKGATSGKLAIIITNFGQAIADQIANEIDRGSTLVKATGTYTGEGREMLYCACGNNEIYKVRTIALTVDPSSLIMIADASEVLGEGFVPPAIPGNELPTNGTGNGSGRSSSDTQNGHDQQH